MKTLVLTNHLHSYAGSEILAIDVAKCFRKLEYQSYISANVIDQNFKNIIKNHSLEFIEEKNIDLNDFDIVWSQHARVIKFLSKQKIKKKNQKIISVHLSPTTEYEIIGILPSTLFTDLFVVNSEETKLKLIDSGINKNNIFNFYNAVTEEFDNFNYKNSLENIAIISNHVPKELLEACELLKEKIDVKIFGIRHDFKLLSAIDLLDRSAIVTIGRSVQASLKAGRPVYCYDHYGGPGWLNKGNFKIAEKFNFSGRGFFIKKKPNEIFNEIINNFNNALMFIKQNHKKFIKKYSLEVFIEKIINHNTKHNKKVNLLDKKILHNSSYNLNLIDNYYKKSYLLALNKEQQAKTITTLHQSLIIKNKYNNDLIKLNMRALNAVDKLTSSKSFKFLNFAKTLIGRKFDILNYFNKIKKEQKFILERTAPIINLQQKKICVYTAIIGSYDELKDPLVINDNIDYICFSDQPLKSTIWQIRPINYYNNNQTRVARYYKVNPHKYLDDYETAIWIDSSLTILNDFKEYLSKVNQNTVLLTQTHFKRKNIFEEKEAIIKENKDLPGILQSQIEFYQSQGFGRNLLFETNFFIANLKNNKTKELFRLWNEQINKYSHRDQISLPYVIDQLKIEEFYLIDDPKKIARFNENHFLFSNHSYKNNYGKSEFKFKFIENFFRKKIEFKICEKSVDVIIPVFNALTYVQKLLKSITLNYYNPSINFIIVNDGSNSETSHFLNNFANNHQNFKIVNNKQNLGYTRSINIGLKHNKSDYKIILNSDTEVNKDWIDYLLLPFQNKKIHIAGPLSNAASYQSVPKVSENGKWIVNNKIKNFEDINKFLLEKFQFEYPLLSHVNGFCMAIKQEVFDYIGYFDEELFKQGYGEENDFCWRALDAGFNIVLNHHCYIYHAKTQSFDLKEKDHLIKNSNKILNEKFGAHRIQNLNETFNTNFFLDHIRHNMN